MSEEKETKIDDRNLKIHQLVDRRGRDATRGKTTGRLFNSTFQASMTPLEKDPWKDMPMITLKHRWMRNRNLVAGNTVVSFNQDGIAKVRDVGNARLDVDKLVQHFGGLISIVGDENERPQPATEPEKVLTPPAPVEAAMAAPEPSGEATEPETDEDVEGEEEPSDEGADPASQPKRKVPPKRKK
jgi:hypothetical protein